MNYRNDPTWRQAQHVFISPDAATAEKRLIQSIAAAVTMWTVERAGETA